MRISNIILSLGVIIFGALLWRYPGMFGFPKAYSWFGLFLAFYGFLRALLFATRPRNTGT